MASQVKFYARPSRKKIPVIDLIATGHSLIGHMIRIRMMMEYGR